ncbi:MAG: hypothetical protein ACI7YS_03990 [Flavobacterium sp.]
MLNNFFNSKLFFFTNDIYIKKLVFYGLLLRFLITAIFYTNITIFPDSGSFMELAEYMLRFDLSGYIGKRSPGYSFLLFLAFGRCAVAVLYQFFIGVFTFVIVYKTIVNLKFLNKNSFVLTIFLQSFLNVFFFETSILIETLSLFFMVLLMYEISKGYLEKSSFKTDLWMGFILGYLVLIKPFYAYIGFLVFGLYVLNDFKWKKLISQKLIILIFPLMAYFGWSYVNKINTGHFVSTTFVGLNISQNCVYFAEKGPKKYDWIMKPYVQAREARATENKNLAMSVWEAEDKELKYKMPYFPDLSAELGKYAVETIKMNPTYYLKQVIFRSWFDFWKPWITWEYDEFNFKYANKPFLLVWYFQALILITFNLLFMGITFGSIRDFFRTRKVSFEFFGLVLVWASSILQALATYGTNAKYRFPFEFIIFLVVILFFRRKNWIPKPLHTFLQ